MRQIDDLTNNSSIWYEYEEQEPIIIQGYQKRATVKVSFNNIYIEIFKGFQTLKVFFRTTWIIYDQKQKHLYQPRFLDLSTTSKLNSVSVTKVIY